MLYNGRSRPYVASSSPFSSSSSSFSSFRLRLLLPPSLLDLAAPQTKLTPLHALLSSREINIGRVSPHRWSIERPTNRRETNERKRIVFNFDSVNLSSFSKLLLLLTTAGMEVPMADHADDFNKNRSVVSAVGGVCSDGSDVSRGEHFH